MFAANAVSVMIASPGDVISERRVVREVIAEWNVVNAEHRKQVLLPVGWETHAYPEIGDRPQGLINKRVLKGCDLLIAVFWTKLGSPTGVAASGTVEEIEEHLKSGKPAMIYFSRVPVVRDSVDDAQYDALRKFKEDFRKRGLIDEYDSVLEFGEKLRVHLAKTMIQQFAMDEAGEGVPSVPPASMLVSQRFQLSDEAKELLVEASKDPNGSIMKIDVIGGLVVQANRRNFTGGVRDNRILSRWRRAVEELVEGALIEDRGYKGEVFVVTSLGYQVADGLVKWLSTPG